MFYYYKNLLQNKFDGLKLKMNVKFKSNAILEPNCVKKLNSIVLKIVGKINVTSLHVLVFYTNSSLSCALKKINV